MTPKQAQILKKIPFAQFILNDIEENGAFLGWALGFDSDYEPVARKSLLTEDKQWSTMSERTDKDDWTYEAGWDLLGYYAHINRGTATERFHIKQRGPLAFQLLLIQDRLRAKQKAAEKAEREKEKQKKLDAAWWP